MKYRVKDLSKCKDTAGIRIVPRMLVLSGQVIEPLAYLVKDGLYLSNGWIFHTDWLEPIEEPKVRKIEEMDWTGIKPIPFADLQDTFKSSKGMSFVSDKDNVRNPEHYQFGKYEPVKVIQDWDLSFCLGNVVKYIARAGRKDSSKLIEDLEKAKRYLEIEIETLRSVE
jgi:hypothetical protein